MDRIFPLRTRKAWSRFPLGGPGAHLLRWNDRRYWKDVPGADEASTRREMEDAREVVQELSDEYEACESKDYIRWDEEGAPAYLLCLPFGSSWGHVGPVA